MKEFHNESMTVAIDKWLLILQWDKNQSPVIIEPIQSILASSRVVHSNVRSMKNSK